jgi:hypothetical protein
MSSTSQVSQVNQVKTVAWNFLRQLDQHPVVDAVWQVK